jgi:hypothetical protein
MTEIALPGYYVPAPALAALQRARDDDARHQTLQDAQDLREAVDDLLEAARRADSDTMLRMIALGEIS